MAYSPTNWTAGTEFTSARANKLETGLADAAADADAAAAAAAAAQADADTALAAAGTAQSTASAAGGVAGQALARTLIVERTFSGTSETAVIGDMFGAVRSLAAAAVTFTIPPASSVAWVTGCTIEPVQGGAGQMTVVAGAGVTIRARDGMRRTAGPEAVLSVRYVGNNVWHLAGDVG